MCVGVAANMAFSLKYGNVMMSVEVVCKRIACNTATNNCDFQRWLSLLLVIRIYVLFEFLFIFLDSRISIGTVRRSHINPSAAKTFKP